MEVDAGEAVRAGGHEAGERWQRRGLASVRPDVLDDEDAKAEQLTVQGGAQLNMLYLSAAVRHRDHVLASRLRPANCTAQMPGEPGDHDVFGVRRDLPAEPAA